MIELRDYQKTAKAALYAKIKSGERRIAWVLGTGAGKSTLASSVVKDANSKGKRTLFMVHSKELVEQFASRLRNQFRVDSAVIMAGVRGDRSKMNQVASVQTLVRRDKPEADIVFIDEAHRSAAKSYQKILDFYPDSIIIGLTATPFRTDGKGLDKIFTSICHTVRIQNLIDSGYLVPTKTYVPKESVNMDGVRVVRGDYDAKEMGERFSKGEIVRGVVKNYQDHAAGKKAICFSVNVELSKEVCERFNAAGIPAAHIDGKTAKAERDKIVAGFRDGRYLVLSNCNIATEGFDVPDCEVVILNRATKSLGMFIQMVGRGLRPAEGKTHCIVLDHGHNTIEHGLVEMYDSMPLGLEGVKKKKGAVAKTKKCKNCGYVQDRFSRKCESCGNESKREERKITLSDGSEFVVLDRDALICARLEKWNWKKKAVPASMLRIYANYKGYKYGWVIREAIEKEYISVPPEHPKFYQILNKELTMAEMDFGVHELSNQFRKACA